MQVFQHLGGDEPPHFGVAQAGLPAIPFAVDEIVELRMFIEAGMQLKIVVQEDATDRSAAETFS